MPIHFDLRGQRFTRWTVLDRSGVRNGHVTWSCRCDCGKLGTVSTGDLHSGQSKSCGCYGRDSTRERLTTHGQTHSRAFCSWQLMKDRCYNRNNKRYQNYGGRGIIVCERWLHSFSNFFVDMGERALGWSIERKDVNGDYTPENCIWLRREKQARNTRRSRRLEANGEKKIMSDWARDLGISTSLLHYHLRRKTLEMVIAERAA